MRAIVAILYDRARFDILEAKEAWQGATSLRSLYVQCRVGRHLPLAMEEAKERSNRHYRASYTAWRATVDGQVTREIHHITAGDLDQFALELREKPRQEL